MWICETFKITAREARGPRRHANVTFLDICQHGNLEVAKWFVMKYRSEVNNSDYNSAFRAACRHCRLDIVSWLVDECPTKIHKSVYAEEMFNACRNGSLGIATWIFYTFGNVTSDDICNVGLIRNELFMTVCINGHLETAQWLYTNHAQIQGTADELRYMCTAFHAVCAFGHFDVAVWMQDTFNFTSEGMRTACPIATLDVTFRRACTHGYLNTAMFLHSNFTITEEEAKFDNNAAFSAACFCGHLTVAKWLHREFNMTREDVFPNFDFNDSMSHSIARYEYSSNSVRLWLRETFLTTVEDDGVRPPRMLCGVTRPTFLDTVEETGLTIEERCCVCFTRRRNLRAEPCNHDEVCHSCAYEWYMIDNNVQDCMMCRRRVLSFVKM